MDYFPENNLVPVKSEYDVIIAGGGLAGVSAALAARRNGCRTLLIEKSAMLGGLATLGLIAFYLPLCDGMGNKVIGGISEELLHLSIKYGHDTLPPQWKPGAGPMSGNARYQTEFSPPEFVIALDELMETEGVEVLFDTVVSSPVMDEDGMCRGVIVENKSGRTGYRCGMAVDCTGDADLLSRARAACVETNNWMSYWSFSVSLDSIRKALQSGKASDAIRLDMSAGDNCGNNAEGFRKYSGTDAADVSQFIQVGRKALKAASILQKDPSRRIVALPGMAQLRTTRRICGLYELKEIDVNKHFSDSVGCIGDWRKPGPVYEIPYRSLISKEVKNIAAAGRMIASCAGAWEVTRVIPAASATGQAAGTAAALAIKEGCSLQEIRVDKLQLMLEKQGIILHWPSNRNVKN